jgi:cobalt/nickel transport protein
MMRKEIWFLLILAVVLAVFISPFASSFPDGLEKVAEDYGFIEQGEDIVQSPLPDYAVPGIANEKLATALAGIVGTLLTLAVVYGIATILKNRTAQKKNIDQRGAVS